MQMNMKEESSSKRINAIGQSIGGIKRYLEIGVAKGSTFFKVNAKEKHAVDPRFRFDVKTRFEHKEEFYYNMTSDEYFSKIKTDKYFDIIFLDGLHTYNQTLRDFINTLSVSHERTIWIIDDTVPVDEISAEPDLNKVRSIRRIQDSNDETWMGDVYKVVVFIESFFKQFTCLTLEGHGQTLVVPSRNIETCKDLDTREIDKLGYLDTVIMKDKYWKPIIFEAALKEIEKVVQDA